MHPCFQELWAYKIHDVVSPNTGPLAMSCRAAGCSQQYSSDEKSDSPLHGRVMWQCQHCTQHLAETLDRGSPRPCRELAKFREIPGRHGVTKLVVASGYESQKQKGCSAPVVFTRKSLGELRLQLSLVSLQVKTSLAKVEAQHTFCAQGL